MDHALDDPVFLQERLYLIEGLLNAWRSFPFRGSRHFLSAQARARGIAPRAS
jgi:hypothetical protein